MDSQTLCTDETPPCSQSSATSHDTAWHNAAHGTWHSSQTGAMQPVAHGTRDDNARHMAHRTHNWAHPLAQHYTAHGAGHKACALCCTMRGQAPGCALCCESISTAL